MTFIPIMWNDEWEPQSQNIATQALGMLIAKGLAQFEIQHL